MSDLIPFADGDYAFIKGVFPYSQGVSALPGFAIERLRFAHPLPVAAGFAAIEAQLKALGRPRTALCAAELRSPKPFSLSGFGGFNKAYVGMLKDWNIYRDDLNPVARSNVAPEIEPPAEVVFHAFCYTVPAKSAAGDYVVAGSGEWPEGTRFPDEIIARGDVSPAGLRTKARWVCDMMQARLGGLQADWRAASATQVYTVHDLHPFLGDEIIARAGNGAGVTWHYCRPPIEGLEYEMDVRRVSVERMI